MVIFKESLMALEDLKMHFFQPTDASSIYEYAEQDETDMLQSFLTHLKEGVTPKKPG